MRLKLISLEVNFLPMKARKASVLCICILLVSVPLISSGQKFLKNLKKSDSYYDAGSYSKAMKSLAKFKSSIEGLGAANTYMST